MHAARRALSHRAAPASRSRGDFSGGCGARSAGRPFKDARGSCMLMAPGAQLLRGGNPGGTRLLSLPTAALGCSSKTLLSPRHWDLVSSLEPLVNLRSGGWPPSSTTVPKALGSPYVERFVLQECTPGKIHTNAMSRRASSEILTPECAPLSSHGLLPTPPHASDSPVLPTRSLPRAWGSRARGASPLSPGWKILERPFPEPLGRGRVF